MAIFNSTDRTPDYLAAVKALKRLPLNLRGPAFAEAEAEELKDAMAGRLGKPTTGRKSWKRLLGRQGDPGDMLPGDDHVELWVNGNQLTYVSHPYGLTLGTLRDIVKVCDDHGLNVGVSGSSWYFPGGTFRVEYTKRV